MNRLFMTLPFAERVSYRGKQEIQNFVEEYLADNLHVEPRKHQVAGDRESWIIRASSANSRAKSVEGRVEALFREGKIESLVFKLR
jgi:hypothetical protein